MLNPGGTLAYGQDFLLLLGDARGEFSSLHKQNETYPIEMIAGATMVVGQNPDDPEESRVLNELGSTGRTAVFVHCQWEYYNDKQQEHVARALEKAALGLTPAEFLSERMSRRFPIPWKTVDGCVDTRFFYPSTEEERSSFRLRHGIPRDRKVVLFTGRLEPAKGIQILREICASPRRDFAVLVQYPAWDSVRAKTRTFQSYLKFRDELEAYPDVHFFEDKAARFDPRSHPKPVRFADIFVSTSLSEVQPLVLLEALASGVPFVGTNSTPDYARLRDRLGANPALSGAIETVDLPNYLNQGATPRYPVALRPEDSPAVADDLVEAINRTPISDDRSRAALSAGFLALGFTNSARSRKFRQALEDAMLEDTFQ